MRWCWKFRQSMAIYLSSSSIMMLAKLASSSCIDTIYDPQEYWRVNRLHIDRWWNKRMTLNGWKLHKKSVQFLRSWCVITISCLDRLLLWSMSTGCLVHIRKIHLKLMLNMIISTCLHFRFAWWLVKLLDCGEFVGVWLCNLLTDW